ncbi:MAG: chloride channel protein [Candidatus Dormibacteraeota bacterium]|nr:chloride channel protein [Candidatus Dormibacteraeota bacterium]
MACSTRQPRTSSRSSASGASSPSRRPTTGSTRSAPSPPGSSSRAPRPSSIGCGPPADVPPTWPGGGRSPAGSGVRARTGTVPNADSGPRAAVQLLVQPLRTRRPVSAAWPGPSGRVATLPTDAEGLLRSRGYLALLLLAAALGAPISAIAHGFLAGVTYLEHWFYDDLPRLLGFSWDPLWWPVPLLFVAGILAAVTVRHLPGRGGHSPADGFQLHGAPLPVELPGIVVAAGATLVLGVVLGPEAPLIAIGGGLAVLAVRLVRRDAPQPLLSVVGAAGSFAAVSTLLGSPLLGAFLLMEVTGVSGATLGLVLVPGLLASGIGALIFTCLGTWTGLGTFSLALPGLPHFDRPDAAEFGWAIAIGVAAALLGWAIRWLALALRPHVERRILLLTPAFGLVVGGLAVLYAATTGHRSSDVLFSGQAAMPLLLQDASAYSLGALALLLACKGLGYGVSLSSFRGEPIFPGMFMGAAGGIALSFLPGLPLVAGVAMGIGAMSATMLRLPLTSVLLATLLLFSNGLTVMPLVIVAVVVAYVVSTRLTPAPTS